MDVVLGPECVSEVSLSVIFFLKESVFQIWAKILTLLSYANVNLYYGNALRLL